MKNSKSTLSNTGYKGVLFRKDQGNFISRIWIEKYKYYINVGSYPTLREAITAREEFIKNLF